MSKLKASKTKKVPEVKEKQKISSFFKKLDPKKESEFFDDDFKVKTINLPPEQKSNEKTKNNDKKVAKKDKPEEKCNSKIPPEVKKPVEQKIKKSALLNDSDDDFVLNNFKPAGAPKEAKTVPSDKINSKKSKSNSEPKKVATKNVSKTSSCKQKVDKLLTAVEEEIFQEVLNLQEEKKCSKLEKRTPDIKVSTKVVPNSPNESKLVVNLDSVNTTNVLTTTKPLITPEKSYLKCDEVLNDVTNTKGLDSLLEDIKLVKSFRQKSPPHSTPVDNLKKRKSPESDIIPQTPEEEIKPKSKICLNNKFKFQKTTFEIEVPEFNVKSPPKKIRKIITEPKIIVNLSEITEKQFHKIHEANFNKPVKETLFVDDISIFSEELENKGANTKKKSPRKGKVNSPNSPKKVSPNLSQPKQCPTEIISTCTSPILDTKVIISDKNKRKNLGTSPSKWSAILKSPPKIHQKEKYCSQSPVKETNSLLDYFKNLPSSCSQKQGVEISADYIVTKKSPIKLDFEFDDTSWDLEIPVNNLNLENWQYCKVTEVTTDLYQNVILKVESVKNSSEKTCVILQGIWRNLSLKSGDKVNVLAKKSVDAEASFCVTNDFGFVVYEPDTLISGTSIVGSLFCKRRGVLCNKFAGLEPPNQMMLVGCIVHRLLQDTLKRKLSTLAEIEKVLFEILDGKDIVFNAYSSNVSIEVMKQQTLPFVQRVLDFVSTYVYSKKTRDQQNWKGTIETIQDIEENIWCYNFGIKGKVDVTVKTTKNNSKQFNAFNTQKYEKTLPLELKTGRASFSLEHRGQVILYTMIMTDLGYDVNSGLLLYLREGVMHEIETKHIEKRDLIMLRNELTYFLNSNPQISVEKNRGSSKSSKTSFKSNGVSPLNFCELPEPIHHHNACAKCPYNLICTTFLTKEKTGDICDTHPIKMLSKEILAHLSETHMDYFVHWASLIHLESFYKPPIKELKDIWRLPPLEREKLGKSLCYLEIFKDVTEKMEPFMHHFKRCQDSETKSVLSQTKQNFLNSGLSIGNYVIVSSENRIAIASGFISKVTKDELVIGLERNLFERYKKQKFHVDTYESKTIFNYSLANIATLLENNPKAEKLRQLIIDKKLPEFASKLTKTVAVVGEKILKRLNKNQQRAILKVLAANDYLLIKGMPGTGKTATIVALIQLLVGLNKSVLITSHTNSAVDNVCLRLLDCGVDVLRLGSESRMHPLLKHCSERAKTSHYKTVEELEEVYNKAQVVATTCLGANHALLSKRTLDVCLVDESTQVLQCSVFKALQSTKTFVLIGDPEQLPPIVSSPEALLRGMNESLFERLHNPENIITLTLQYRMNKTITQLANNLTYNGQLLCADDSIGYAILRLPKIERLQTIYFNEPWLLSVLDTHVDNSVIAIDTGPTSTKMGKNKDALEDLKVPVQNVQEDEERKYENVFEVAVVSKIIEALKEAGVQSEAIGVIAPYKFQVDYLKKVVSKIDEKFESKEQIEVNTVDQYQGRDKEVIIYSCTKSLDISKTKTKSIFEILEDKRRLTVAITRAKHKLIIIGDFCTLKTYSPFEILLNSLEPHQVLPLAYESKGFTWDRAMDRLKIYDS